MATSWRSSPRGRARRSIFRRDLDARGRVLIWSSMLRCRKSRFPVSGCRFPGVSFVSLRDHPGSDEEQAMKYVVLIYQGNALERQAALTEEEQKQVYADYQGINQTPGVTPGLPMGL